ncbi:hypothetical protein [Methylomonas koyamae]|uniref:hypothetical protein n=1 Tax=Methylomonas koyamae TaxID=702114 RepID=UPI0012F6944F|nr:hypothetical protein [Methylomonas koyamae]
MERRIGVSAAARPETLLSDRSGVALFRPDANGFRIEFHRESAAEDAAVWQLDANAADAYRNLKHLNPELDKAECLLRLNPGQALQKRLFLPAAAQENLQQVVGFELDRYTPFSADQVYYAAIVLGKTEFGQIEVLLVLTPKPLLDDYLARCKRWACKRRPWISAKPKRYARPGCRVTRCCRNSTGPGRITGCGRCIGV